MKNYRLDPNKVGRIVEWYEHQTAPELMQLMEERRKLVAQSFYYASALGELDKRVRQSKIAVKSLFASRVKAHKQAGESVAAAERLVEAELEYIARMREYESEEGAYAKGKMQLQTIKEVIRAMHQDIAEARHEREETPVTDGQH